MPHDTCRSARGICRREFLKKTLVATAAGSSLFSLPPRARAQKTGTIRVWTEPGPQAAVIGDAQWAELNLAKKNRCLWCPEPDSNRHGPFRVLGILSPVCLPIPPSGQRRQG